MITEYSNEMQRAVTVPAEIRDAMTRLGGGGVWETREYDTYTREGERMVVHQVVMHGEMVKDATLWVSEDVTPWREYGGKFASAWAERLWDWSMDGLADEDLGEADGFGYYATFNHDRAIMSTDTYGFVYAEVFDTEAEHVERWDRISRAHDEWCEREDSE